MTDVMTDYVGRKIWYSFLYLHQLGISCVPLFLILTGYLNREKKLSAGYFRGLTVTALSYICICIIGLVISHLREEIITFGSAVHSIFNFTANGSAWYFEMYAGLYILIPFINLV
jgi:surface polysaccharide O-acyltransferase-like enzyme